jgi:hypothetical protein
LWDSSVGAEILVGGFSDGDGLSAWVAGAGAAAYAASDGGRAWAELALGTRAVGGLLLGVAGGPVVDLDPLRHPRWGGRGSLWLFAGLSPYVAVGAVTDGGVTVDLGVRLPLPAVRW